MKKLNLNITLILIMVWVLVACNSPMTQRQPNEPEQSSVNQNIGNLPKDQHQINSRNETQRSEPQKKQASKTRNPTAIKRKLVTPSIQSSEELAAKPYSFAIRRADPVLADIRTAQESVDRENYAHTTQNPVMRAEETPVSSFSIDVDTGSYTNIRRMIRQGRIPPKDAIRAEEFINYFNYQYPAPANKTHPFMLSTEMGPTPWNPNSVLLNIGIKGFEIPKTQRPASNLVFLVDVSGSMRSDDKLGLLKNALKLLSNQLGPQDKISLAVYAGASGVVLEPTPGDQKFKILNAIDKLYAGGSTNGAAGIRLAYSMAQQAYIKDGINRIVLATDGDFNVGTVNFESLKNLVEEKRISGVSLTTLGFGTGNFNDHLMEQLADAGNGNYSYIDTLNEAQKVLVDELSSTLYTIAKDVKIQIEFNPQIVAEYRLIGYENRKLKREDFNNDKIDAGEIGAGHTVTALYELFLVGRPGQLIDPLRYGTKTKQPTGISSEMHSGSADIDKQELAFLRLRYKLPDQDTSQLVKAPIKLLAIKNNLSKTSDRFRFAASVAAYSQVLRGGTYTKNFGYADIITLAHEAKANDAFGYRGEFINLVRLTQSLSAGDATQQQNIVQMKTRQF